MYRSKTLATLAFSVAGISFIIFQSCRKPQELKEDDLNEWYSGGKQTVFISGSSAFSQEFNGLSAEKSALHGEGDHLFGATFNSDPNQLFHGLGPIYNNVSCASCHVGDGGGKAPNAGENLSSLLLRLSVPGENNYGGPLAVPLFGGQLQPRAILGITRESDVSVTYSENTYQFADGEIYSLRQPQYTLTSPYTSLPAGVMISPRIASPVFGMGLLESIPESDILAHADENDADHDGISGRPNYTWDIDANTYKLGRFGWKASQPTVTQQSAGAFSEDMGITNRLFPLESSNGQAQLATTPNTHELSDSSLYAISYYVRTLAVPGRRNADDADVKNGKRLFNSIGCSNCHVSMHKTETNMQFPELSNQVIFPYTDLLLHDMGTGLADNRPDNKASGTEWRTAPLWGIGLTKTVVGHTHFLHDGRARNFVEAIMWHGGEATGAKNAFRDLSKTERDQLVKFLGSL